MLILIFIFLTPKTWFASNGYQRTHAIRTVSVEVVNGRPDKTEAERRAIQTAGTSGATVSDIRELRDASGTLVRYEVDIH